MWYDLQIFNHKLKITPLSPEEKDYPSCDDNGKPLNWVKGTATRGYFQYDDGTRFEGEPCKLVNGKAVKGMPRTKVPKNPQFVEPIEKADAIFKDCVHYLVDDESGKLYDELMESKKDVTFVASFSNQKSFKGYKCYLYPSEVYKGFLELLGIRGKKSTRVKQLVEELQEKKKLKEKLAQLDNETKNLNSVSEEDLINF